MSSPNSTIIDRLDPGPLPADTTVGRAQGGLDTYYVFGLGQTTPDEANHNFGEAPPDPFIQSPIFSVRGGVFSGAVTLDLLAPVDGDVIRYTTDGSEPNATSTIPNGPIELTETTVIRAIVSGTPDSRIQTHTYFVDVDHDLLLISMASEPANFEFADGYLYGFGEHMFTQAGNIIGNFPYSSSNAWKRSREVEASVEVYEPGNGEKLRINAGLKMFGGWGSRGYPQKSMALFARSEYGYGKIRHPFFPDKPVDSFESIVPAQLGERQPKHLANLPAPAYQRV